MVHPRRQNPGYAYVGLYAAAYAALPDRSLCDQLVLLGITRLLLALLHRLRGPVRLPRRPDCRIGNSVARALRGRRASWSSWHGSVLGVVFRILVQR